jgi:hypothetical protein
MEWTIEFLPDRQIVVIQTQGVADKITSLEMAKSITQALAQHRVTRCLIDHSALSAVSGGTVEIYYRPQELGEVGVPPAVKIAEVVQFAHRAHFTFLETVCRNRGFNFAIFADRESALQWLTSSAAAGDPPEAAFLQRRDDA